MPDNAIFCRRICSRKRSTYEIDIRIAVGSKRVTHFIEQQKAANWIPQSLIKLLQQHFIPQRTSLQLELSVCTQEAC